MDSNKHNAAMQEAFLALRKKDKSEMKLAFIQQYGLSAVTFWRWLTQSEAEPDFEEWFWDYLQTHNLAEKP